MNPYLLAVGARRLLAILPSTTPAGTGTLTVTYNSRTSAAFNLRVALSAFGFFTLNGAGYGPILVVGTDLEPSTLFKPLRPGSIAIAIGTGLGPTALTAAAALPRDLSLEGILDQVRDLPEDTVAQTTSPFQLRIDGQPTPYLYAGPIGGIPGASAVVFRVPIKSGCWQSIWMDLNASDMDRAPSNTGSVSIGDGDVCDDPYGEPVTLRRRWLGTDPILYGEFYRERAHIYTFSRLGQNPIAGSGAFLSIVDFPFQALKDSHQLGFGCQHWSYRLGAVDPLAQAATFRGAGTVGLFYPDGSGDTMSVSTGSPVYSARVGERAFVLGNFRLRASGSTEVRPFDITFPYAFPLENRFAVVTFPGVNGGVVPRSRDFIINAAGWPPRADYNVRVDLTSTNRQLDQVARLACRFRGDQTSFVLPEPLMRRMTPSGMQNGVNDGSIAIHYRPNRATNVDIPAGGGRTLDAFDSLFMSYSDVKIE